MPYEIERIPFGNDEAILRLRKHGKRVGVRNPDLGKEIWAHILSLDQGAQYTVEDAPCFWGTDTPNTADTGLPKTATQFSIDPSILPDLYRWLDQLD